MVDMLHITRLDKRLLSDVVQRFSRVIWSKKMASTLGLKVVKAYMLECEQERHGSWNTPGAVV